MCVHDRACVNVCVCARAPGAGRVVWCVCVLRVSVEDGINIEDDMIALFTVVLGDSMLPLRTC